MKFLLATSVCILIYSGCKKRADNAGLEGSKYPKSSSEKFSCKAPDGANIKKINYSCLFTNVDGDYRKYQIFLSDLDDKKLESVPPDAAAAINKNLKSLTGENVSYSDKLFGTVDIGIFEGNVNKKFLGCNSGWIGFDKNKDLFVAHEKTEQDKTEQDKTPRCLINAGRTAYARGYNPNYSTDKNLFYGRMLVTSNKSGPQWYGVLCQQCPPSHP